MSDQEIKELIAEVSNSDMPNQSKERIIHLIQCPNNLLTSLNKKLDYAKSNYQWVHERIYETTIEIIKKEIDICK